MWSAKTQGHSAGCQRFHFPLEQRLIPSPISVQTKAFHELPHTSVDFDQWLLGANRFTVDMNQRQPGFWTRGHRLFNQAHPVIQQSSLNADQAVLIAPLEDARLGAAARQGHLTEQAMLIDDVERVILADGDGGGNNTALNRRTF